MPAYREAGWGGIRLLILPTQTADSCVYRKQTTVMNPETVAKSQYLSELYQVEGTAVCSEGTANRRI